MKIGFDYDGTLSVEKYRLLAEKFVSNNDDVWVVTSRLKKSKHYNNNEVFETAKKAGIAEDHILFTEGVLKHHELTDFDLFFDNDLIEIEFIEDNTNCSAILV